MAITRKKLYVRGRTQDGAVSYENAVLARLVLRDGIALDVNIFGHLGIIECVDVGFKPINTIRTAWGEMGDY